MGGSEPVRSFAKASEPRKAGLEPAGGAPRKSALREYGEAFGIAILLALIIRTFLIQAYKIPSGSMEPTLLIGDHLLVDKLAYGLRLPDTLFGLKPLSGIIPYGHYVLNFGPVHRGDVVVFVFPLDRTKDFIKRVIGVAGDVVAVKNGRVYLNGAPMPDPHGHYDLPLEDRTRLSPRDNFGPVTVPKGKLLMMGDNRDHSYDSRFWGYVNRNAVEGKALVIYWSWNSDSNSLLPVRWRRFGMVIR
ncbi:MAG TPA: signal peptidase I [Candidatus Binataceae bacterium]|nr:signal peptidase I [Candidatus Binataceae bacterium]